MIQLLAVGDIALGGDYSILIQREGPHFPFALVTPCLKQGDIVFGNVEVPLSDQGKPDPSKPICLRGPSTGIDALASAGFTHVSLANNHAHDYGVVALRDTQQGLAQAGIATVGVGRDLADSRRPLIQPFPGGTLAFLAYNAYTTGGRYYAHRNREGSAPLEYCYIREDVRSLRERYDPLTTVVSLHWGVEGNHYPTPFQRHLAHRIIEDGANLILGHHPHVIQSIERYRNGVIVYSLGNFAFPDISSQHVVKGLSFKQQLANKESFIFKCEITPDGITAYQTIPIYINEHLQPCLASGRRKSDLLEQMTRYGEPLSDVNYEQFYKKELGPQGGYVSRLGSLLKREGIGGIVRRLQPRYLQALAIEFQNRLREARHQRQVLREASQNVSD